MSVSLSLVGKGSIHGSARSSRRDSERTGVVKFSAEVRGSNEQ